MINEYEEKLGLNDMIKNAEATSQESILDNIRDYCVEKHPSDELGFELNSITFADVAHAMNKGWDVYSVLGVCDSSIREMVFEGLSDRLGVDYNTVYNKWLHPDEYPDLPLPEQNNRNREDTAR